MPGRLRACASDEAGSLEVEYRNVRVADRERRCWWRQRTPDDSARCCGCSPRDAARRHHLADSCRQIEDHRLVDFKKKARGLRRAISLVADAQCVVSNDAALRPGASRAVRQAGASAVSFRVPQKHASWARWGSSMCPDFDAHWLSTCGAGIRISRGRCSDDRLSVVRSRGGVGATVTHVLMLFCRVARRARGQSAIERSERETVNRAALSRPACATSRGGNQWTGRPRGALGIGGAPVAPVSPSESTPEPCGWPMVSLTNRWRLTRGDQSTWSLAG